MPRGGRQPKEGFQSEQNRLLKELDQAGGLVNMDALGTLEPSDVERATLHWIQHYLTNAQKSNSANYKEIFGKQRLPPFSEAKWSQYLLDHDLPALTRPSLAFPTAPRLSAQLPPRLLKHMTKEAHKATDVYRPFSSHTREERRVRFLEPYMVEILSLFFGRLSDRPDCARIPTSTNSGGKVRHEVVGFNGIWICIIEAKLLITGDDPYAQLLAELESACAHNAARKFPQKRVFGIITDQALYRLYSMGTDGVFYHGKYECVLKSNSRAYFMDMIPIANMIFGVMLESFRLALECIKDISLAKHDTQDSSDPSQAMPALPDSARAQVADGRRTRRKIRPSLENYEAALCLIEDATAMLKPGKDQEGGIKKLEEACLCLPRYGEEGEGEEDDDGLPGFGVNSAADRELLADKIVGEFFGNNCVKPRVHF